MPFHDNLRNQVTEQRSRRWFQKCSLECREIEGVNTENTEVFEKMWKRKSLCVGSKITFRLESRFPMACPKISESPHGSVQGQFDCVHTLVRQTLQVPTTMLPELSSAAPV